MVLVPASEPALAPDASLSVAAVAAIVGVAPSTLRTWARRYGLEPSEHRSGLHRRYTQLDLSRLQLMRSLTQSGLSSREAAIRARDATPEQLLAALGGRRPVDDPVRSCREARPQAPSAPHWGRPGPEDLDQAVRMLLATVGRGDARGASALLRMAVRDLGAARAFDERVRAVRTSLWLLPPPVQERARHVLSAAVVSAVGDAVLRRERRNVVPVYMAHLPTAEDHAAVALVHAALAERCIGAERLALGASDAEALRRIERTRGGVIVVFAGEGAAAGRFVSRLRAAGRGAVVFWGEGWIHWPGQQALLTDVVRAVELASLRQPEIVGR